MPKTTLLSPGSVQGFLSARAPSALPKGSVSLLENARLDDGTVRARWGAATIQSAVFGAYAFRGCFECVQNGVPTLFWAGRSSGRTTVLRSTDGGAAWTEILPSSGTYGDARFPTEGWVRFALVTFGGLDYLVMQNGADAPRVYSGSSVLVVPSTTQTPNATVSANFARYSQFTASPTFVAPNPTRLGANWLAAGTGHYVTVVVDSTVVSGDTVELQGLRDPAGSVIPLPFSPPDGSQIGWLVDAPSALWGQVKVEASASDSGGSWVTVYDPSATAVVAIPSTGNTSLVVSSNLRDVAASLPELRSLRLTWIGDPPAADTAIKLYQIGFNGGLAGNTTYGFAYVPASPFAGLAAGRVVCPKVSGAIPSGATLPLSSLVDYNFSLAATVASYPAGFGGVRFYRQDDGQAGYYRLADLYGVGTLTYLDAGDDTDLTKPAPRADALTMPTGTAMESVNGRLFVGSGNRLYYSESGNPFSFALTVQFDDAGSPVDTSAGSFSKPGETFQAIVGIGQVLTGSSVGTPLSGAVTVYAITDRLTYALSGWDAASLNRTVPICVGTRSPFSVARGNGLFYLLDSERQVRKVQGSSSVALSKQAVDDLTLAVPDSALPTCWGAFHDGRYRLSTGSCVLVFSEPLSAFESVDRHASPLVALLPWYDASRSRVRVLGFGSTSMVETEVPGQTTDPGSQPVALKVVCPELGFGSAAAKVGGAAFVTDPDPTGTATYSLYATTGTRIGSLPDLPVPLAPRKAGESRVAARTRTGYGLDSLSAQPSLTLSCKGGTRLYWLFLDLAQGPDLTTA